MTRSPFTLDDFIAQMNQIKKLGPMSRIMRVIPGMSDMMKQLNMQEGEIERQLRQIRAMYNSMTPSERQQPDLIQHARRRRIAHGAGVKINDINTFLKNFEQARGMMRAVGSMGVTGRITSTPRPKVLGLVTNNPAHRDPSHIHHTPNRWIWYTSLLLASLLTLAAILCFRWPSPK